MRVSQETQVQSELQTLSLPLLTPMSVQHRIPSARQGCCFSPLYSHPGKPFWCYLLIRVSNTKSLTHMTHPGCWMVPRNFAAFVYFVYWGEHWHHRAKLSVSGMQQKEANYLTCIIYLGTIITACSPWQRSPQLGTRGKKRWLLLSAPVQPQIWWINPPTSCKYTWVFSVSVAYAPAPRTHVIDTLVGTGTVFPQCAGKACQFQAVTALEGIPSSLCSPSCEDHDILNKRFLRLQCLWPPELMKSS